MTAEPFHKNHGDYVVISLLYGREVIKKQASRLGGYENAVMATYNAEAESYNRMGWAPSFDLWLMTGARILMDSLTNNNSRKVDYAYTKKDDTVSLCCTGAAQFWFNLEGQCVRFQSPECSHILDEDEIEVFMSKIDPGLLQKAFLKATGFDRDEYSAAKRRAKNGATAREEKEAEEKEKLAQYLANR